MTRGPAFVAGSGHVIRVDGARIARAISRLRARRSADARTSREPPGSQLEPVAALSRDSATGYRPALDGIRAVAVLSVMAYHFGYRWAPGGFLGVDVFFVLSGYLITSLLLAERARTGRIALREFWLRRARRLLPALFVMLIAVSVWIGLNAAPFELAMRREDLLWTLFYGSNWHFIASGQDYFAQYVSASPLRHTWSLAIEEQFYIAWPLLVAGALWIGRRRPAVLAAVCIVGIAVSGAAMALLFEPGDPSRAYYGTDARAHQLLIGALLAVLMSRQDLRTRFRRAAVIIAPVAALALLVAFATVRDQGSAYYHGLSVLLAVTTAALVWAIEVNPRQPVGRVLSLRPVAWVGQLSYGLYLWHWPVILAVTTAPAWLAGLPGATTGLNLTRLAVIFGITIASFYVIEQPIRRGRMPVLGRSGRRFAAAATAAALVVSGTAVASTPTLLPGQRQAFIPNCPKFSICVRHQGPTGAPVLAVIGDSIALSLDPAFLDLATEHGWTYVIQADYGCRVGHLLSVTPWSSDKADQCYARTPSLHDELLATWKPSLIVMADVMETTDIVLADGRRVLHGSDEALALSGHALEDAARQLTGTGAQLAMLSLPPSLPEACQRASNFNAPTCTFSLAGFPSSTARYDALYERLAATLPGVAALSITSGVCPNGVCMPVVDGTLLRWDGLHFSADGARVLVPTLEAQLDLVPAWHAGN